MIEDFLPKEAKVTYKIIQKQMRVHLLIHNLQIMAQFLKLISFGYFGVVMWT